MFQDDSCRLLCFRMIFCRVLCFRAVFRGVIFQLQMTVVSWLIEFSGLFCFGNIYLWKWSIDVTTFNVAPFRNLTYDKNFSLLGTHRHAFGGFFLAACNLNHMWTRGATFAVLFHFFAHLLSFFQ